MLSQIVVSGLAMGAIYALLALGYAFVWLQSRGDSGDHSRRKQGCRKSTEV
jgi:hypothetical protein